MDELISIRKEFGHCMDPWNIIKGYFIKFSDFSHSWLFYWNQNNIFFNKTIAFLPCIPFILLKNTYS